MDNATFVENLLDRIRDYADNSHVHTESILVSLRDYYEYDKDEAQLTYKISKSLINKIDIRVKDLLDVLDPMWFVVALYHRNKGGLWRDMHKYGVKRDYASSYKVEKPSNGEPVVYTDKFNSEGLPTL